MAESRAFDEPGEILEFPPKPWWMTTDDVILLLRLRLSWFWREGPLPPRIVG